MNVITFLADIDDFAQTICIVNYMHNTIPQTHITGPVQGLNIFIILFLNNVKKLNWESYEILD